MANGKIRFGKQSGGTLDLVIPDGVANTELVLPESGNIASVDTAVTDNAIARYDGTTGKVQNSGVVIADNGNVGINKSNPDTRLEISSDNSLLPAGSPQLIISGNSNRERAAIRSGSTGNSVITLGMCGGTVETPTATTNAMFLGGYQFGGYGDDTIIKWGRGAQVSGYAVGTWTSSSTPANIVLQTVATGSTALSDRLRIESGGNILSLSPNGGLGYGTGSGGTVTQLTSKSTAVTLNKPSGEVLTHNAALAAGASVIFIINNSLAGTYDTSIAVTRNGNYDVKTMVTSNGVIYVKMTNVSGSTLSESVPINFTVLKGANS